MVHVKTFCGCCPLRTGAAILGWIGVVYSLLNLTSIMLMFVYLDTFFPKDIISEEERTKLFSSDMPSYIDEFPERRNFQYSNIVQALSTTVPTVITFNVTGLIANIMLLIGAARGNRYMLVPWLIMTMATLTSVTAILAIFICLSGIVSVLLSLFFGFPLIGLILYWWLCVLSLFKELRVQNQIDGKMLVSPPTTIVTSCVTDDSPPPYEKIKEDV